MTYGNSNVGTRANVTNLIADARAHEARVLANHSAADVKQLKTALRRLIARKG